MINLTEKISKLFAPKNLVVVLSFLGLYLISSGTSWAIFSYLKSEPDLGFEFNGLQGSREQISQDLPRTAECPTNGAMFTEPEKAIWEERRPITVIIENHLDSRPQSGLSRADVLYEVVAEGGITRFLAVYYCAASAEDLRIGPIRSARVYFTDWAAEYSKNPLYVHVGGANNICQNCPGGVKTPGTVGKEVRALEELVSLGWRRPTGNALDAGANVGFPVVWRDYERIPGAATEHTFMGSTDKLFQTAIDRGFGYKDAEGIAWDEDFVRWSFAEDNPLPSPKASDISFEFWSIKSEYDVTWKYDKTTNSYTRFHGDKPHIDMDNEEQLSAKNVVIQFLEERGPVDKELHMFYTTEGVGEALIFQNGDVIEGTWKKLTQTSRTKFFDADGREISFIRGIIWIEAVPEGNEVNF